MVERQIYVSASAINRVLSVPLAMSQGNEVGGSLYHAINKVGTWSA